MIRRFLRWLLREDLSAAFSAGGKLAHAAMEEEAKMRERLAYATGELAGRASAFEAMDEYLGRRRMEAEDVDFVRKRCVH